MFIVSDTQKSDNYADKRGNITAIPHIIKYMGSKKPIIDFITNAIVDIHTNPDIPVCDLFSGSCSVSAALRKQLNFISNDVQEYSAILAKTYFSDLSQFDYSIIHEQILLVAKQHESRFKTKFPDLFFDYSKVQTLELYQHIESLQRQLLDGQQIDFDYHLFVKMYSGTYWSFEQCVWIDSLRKSAEEFKTSPVYYPILSSLMYAMSYTTQSTGHFAQYRDGNSIEAINNIITYRQKNLLELFSKKLKELFDCLDNSLKTLLTTTLSFEICLESLPEGCTVYADPPYAPVHYSRFYHALETLTKYDYPTITHKGRYRDDRHQSPFSQKTKATKAFEDLFRGVLAKKAQLVLSYSDNGVVKIEEIKELAESIFTIKNYDLHVKPLEHKHSTMGRFEDPERDVVEYLIVASFKRNA
ncbi:DNA adenine methylase [Mucilaginibacter sp. OK283]|jgi:adenine-specific DNA-methyltransferase|uniref:DNA adenine methylase n=1 Tax=Mucilaginibacter sp. OK283 TaxID=1881049 RepID=UPI0008C14D3F|nr:DNA adenine methylase [Mucilaginibacter sp. OK283]SEO14806.1 adenine-specific DNA-methyltransferase [Mucilaginibacter sp. OK283]